jgi:hypothetical protein
MRDPAAMPEDSLPLSLELHIDAACRSFEAAWKVAGNGGARPWIEDYLSAAGTGERAPLLRELIKVELHYRRDEHPSADEYRQRFPAYGQLLGPLAHPAGEIVDWLRALGIMQKLTDEFPHNPEFAHDLAFSYFQRGYLYDSTAKMIQAEELFDRALRLCQVLTESDPQNPNYRFPKQDPTHG